MRYKIPLFALLIGAVNVAYGSISVQDDSGRTIVLQKPAERVVSLAPGITETLYAIGAGKQVVGVSVDSDYPLAASRLPQVGGFQNVNIEAIVALKPDLVIVWGPSGVVPQLAALAKFNIPVYVVNNPNIPAISTEMQNLGKLTGNSTRANREAAQFLIRYKILQAEYSLNKIKPSVFIQVSSNPIYTVGNHSLSGQIIALCGGRNIFGHMKTYAGMTSVEQIIDYNPQVIIGYSPFNPASWNQWQQMAAVKNHHVVTIEASLVARDGPRILEGAEQVCQAIQKAR
ncbi:MAG: cobalamin-binding protein [Gammaproteobacteria bacterium]|nr:cobalamin-binding protein [Gammaproteobacteria bacterium]